MNALELTSEQHWLKVGRYTYKWIFFFLNAYVDCKQISTIGY